MNKICFILCLSLVSCQYFEKQIPNENELLQNELQKINWTQVDEYPSVFPCDTILNKKQQQQCFFNYLSTEISQKIQPDSLQLIFPTIDTIRLKITVMPNKTSTFQLHSPINTIPSLDSIIQKKLTNFPAINPASKRGIKVKSQFILPIILQKK